MTIEQSFNHKSSFVMYHPFGYMDHAEIVLIIVSYLSANFFKPTSTPNPVLILYLIGGSPKIPFHFFITTGSEKVKNTPALL